MESLFCVDPVLSGRQKKLSQFFVHYSFITYATVSQQNVCKLDFNSVNHFEPPLVKGKWDKRKTKIWGMHYVRCINAYYLILTEILMKFNKKLRGFTFSLSLPLTPHPSLSLFPFLRWNVRHNVKKRTHKIICKNHVLT